MNRISFAALATIATLFTACGSSTDTGPQPVTIDFKALVGNQPFSCADTAGYAIGTGTLPWIPKDFRFHVSNVRLVDAGGAEGTETKVSVIHPRTREHFVRSEIHVEEVDYVSEDQRHLEPAPATGRSSPDR